MNLGLVFDYYDNPLRWVEQLLAEIATKQTRISEQNKDNPHLFYSQNHSFVFLPPSISFFWVRCFIPILDLRRHMSISKFILRAAKPFLRFYICNLGR